MIPIEQEIIHPLYGTPPNLFAHDLMLIKLSRKSTKPLIRIRRELPNNQERMTVIGFGHLSLSQVPEIPDKLQEVELGYISNEQCQEMYADLPDRVSDDMMCTREKDKDAW